MTTQIFLSLQQQRHLQLQPRRVSGAHRIPHSYVKGDRRLSALCKKAARIPVRRFEFLTVF